MLWSYQYRASRHFIYLVSLIAATGGFLFGFDTGIISGALLFIDKTFPMTTVMQEWTVSSVVLGAFAGALCSGRLADYFGRRTMLLVAAVVFLLGTALTAFAVNVTEIVVGRFILGLAIGVTAYTVPLFISEMAPADKRGGLVLLNAITVTGGEAIAYLVDAALAPTQSWRLMFAVGFVPAAMLLVGMLFMPATPRWLSRKGLQDEARRVLQMMRNRSDVSAELAEIKASLSEKTGRWQALFSKRVRPVLIVGLGLGILQQFVGINTVMYYGPLIFKAAGFQGETSQILATFGLGAVNTLVSVVAVFTVDKFGRRALLMSGLLIAGISLAIVGALFRLPGQTQHALLVLFMTLYIIGYAISIGSLFWLIIAEIYPLHIRGVAMSFVSGMQWAANFVVSATFLTILHGIGPRLTFWLYGLMCFVGILFCFLSVPETKGVSLEHIERGLDAGKPSRKLGL